MESILISIKKMLGITKEYKHFDEDIIMHINSVFMILNQLGVGPEEGFFIEDDKVYWEDYISDPTQLQAVKSYMHYKVKLLFDPPSSSVIMNCMNQMINELEWRLNVAVDPAQSQ
jgi:hypothetical protein